MTRKEIIELTSLRGLAACFILITHTIFLIPFVRETVFHHQIQMAGVTGMSLFFILSGIVIYYSYAEKIYNSPKKEIPRFFLARFARLYPLYFVFIVGFFVYNLFTPPYNSNPHLAANITSLPIFLVGMQSWFYGFIDNLQVINLQGKAMLTWSISVELALYFLFIPLLFMIYKIKNVKLLFLCLLLIIVLRYIYIYECYFDKTFQNILEAVFPGHPENAWVYLVYYSPLSRLFEFIAGCFLAKFLREDIIENKQIRVVARLSVIFGAALLFCLAFKIILFELDTHLLVSPALVFICFGIMILGSKLLQNKFFIFLGEISYSTYLLHIIFVMALYYEGKNLDSIFLTLVSFFCLTFGLSYLVYKYFEVPMRRYIRGYFD